MSLRRGRYRRTCTEYASLERCADSSLVPQLPSLYHPQGRFPLNPNWPMNSLLETTAAVPSEVLAQFPGLGPILGIFGS